MKMLVAQLCAFCDSMDWSPSGSSIHGILHARILEWIVIPFSKGSSRSWDWTQVCALQANSLASEPPGKPNNLEEKKPALETPCHFVLRNFKKKGKLYLT